MKAGGTAITIKQMQSESANKRISLATEMKKH